MAKNYLFFVSLAYSYPILRPLQKEIELRGDNVAWFIEEGCSDLLNENEKRLNTIEEVMRYNPIAVITPENLVYDFFPGVKICLFHGYAINKRVDKNDEHFKIRNCFDIYCTHGESSTPTFKELEKKHQHFKVYETGWPKVDPFFEEENQARTKNERPLILYSSTFSKKITSAPHLLETITHLIETKPWDWIITLHPKLDDTIVEQYKNLASTYPNVTFCRFNDGLNTYKNIDVMVCDTSSIIVEVMLLNKPVVTFRNTIPGKHLLNILHEEELGGAIEKALTHPAELMENMKLYTSHHESHRDGKNSVRVLDAIDDFIKNYKGKIKSKPLNIIRKLKLRLKTKYYKF